MNKVKQIIRYHIQGCGSKKISSSTGVSRNVVKHYIRRFQALGLSFGELDASTDEQVYGMFFGEKQVASAIPDLDRYKRLQAALPEICKALKKKGVSIEKEWKRYREHDPDGYAKTRFYLYVQEYRKRSGLTMHIEHKAGDKMFIDFCGDKLRITDPGTGEETPVETYVAILGYSQLTYVQACRSQNTEDSILSTRHALEYFGGSPKAIVPDNFKAAVTRSSKYEPKVNETFETFAEHYGTVILPARAYKPRDKALVENAVRLVYQRIYTALRERVFTSLQELNNAIAELLEAHNNAPLKGGDSRRQIFEQEEKETLLALPAIPYEIKKIKECTVMKNGHVGLHEDRHYYSVPYQYVGKKVKMIYDSDKVEIYRNYKPIASHQRNYRRNRYTTVADHLASQHQFLSEWNPEFFIGKARQISPEVAEFIEKLLESKAHPEQGYKACNGILNLARRVGKERITGACRRALEFESYYYGTIEEILAKRLDKVKAEEESQPHRPTPSHSNLRGKVYYQQQSLNLKPNNHE